jgi:hypothetical protein
LKFENVSQSWGFEDSTFSNGAAVADFDNDGDLDLVINNLDEEASMFENNTNKKNNYIKIKLAGPENNPDGIGAKISLYYDGKMQQAFQQKTVRGYLSSNEPAVHFGLGKTTAIDSIIVSWPDGKENRRTSVTANQETKADYKSATTGYHHSIYNTSFAVATSQFLSEPFLHKENKYDEYTDQVLLPHEFSRSGPFIATGDVNGDGKKIFILEEPKKAGSLYIQKNGKFIKQSMQPLKQIKNMKTWAVLSSM